METNPFVLGRRPWSQTSSRLRLEFLVAFVMIASLSILLYLNQLAFEVLLFMIFTTLLYLVLQLRTVIQLNQAGLMQLNAVLDHFETTSTEKGDRQDFVIDPTPYRSRFLVRKGQRWLVIQVDEIAWVIIKGKLCLIRTWDNRRFVIDFTLEELAKMLDPNFFFRINRNYLVHIHAIKSIKPYFGGKLFLEIHPQPEGEIIVSKEKAMEVKKWLGR